MGSTPPLCVPMLFIGSYSIVGRQGMAREHVTMLLVAELSERENRGVFGAFCFVDGLVGFGVFCVLGWVFSFFSFFFLNKATV